MEGEKINMSVSKKEIEKIKNMKYMSNKQIIEVHQHAYKKLIEGIQKLRGGDSIGDIFVPILIKSLLIETEKRFKGE